MLLQIDFDIREVIGNFLIAYMKQTKRQTIPLSNFVSNLRKAYTMGKFGVKEAVNGLKLNNNVKNPTNNEYIRF